MRGNDAELIRRTLAGDETAFTMLVKNIVNMCTHLHGIKSAISTSLKILRRKPFCKFIEIWRP